MYSTRFIIQTSMQLIYLHLASVSDRSEGESIELEVDDLGLKDCTVTRKIRQKDNPVKKKVEKKKRERDGTRVMINRVEKQVHRQIMSPFLTVVEPVNCSLQFPLVLYPDKLFIDSELLSIVLSSQKGIFTQLTFQVSCKCCRSVMGRILHEIDSCENTENIAKLQPYQPKTTIITDFQVRADLERRLFEPLFIAEC